MLGGCGRGVFGGTRSVGWVWVRGVRRYEECWVGVGEGCSVVRKCWVAVGEGSSVVGECWVAAGEETSPLREMWSGRG